MPMPSDEFGLPGAWQNDGKHWHAHVEAIADPAERSADRLQRIQREPDAVLTLPEAVTDWISPAWAADRAPPVCRRA